MRVILLIVLSFFTLSLWACGDEEQSIKVPFAKVGQKNESKQWMRYEIFAPEKNGRFYLTSIYLHKEGELYISLKFKDAYTYPEYKEAFVEIGSNYVDEYDLYLGYSTMEDGGIVMCGNVIKSDIKKMLQADQPKEVIPPPPLPSKR